MAAGNRFVTRRTDKGASAHGPRSPSPRPSGERAGVRGFDPKMSQKILRILSPALSSLGGGEGEIGGSVKMRPLRRAQPGERILPNGISRFEPLSRGTVPGSAGVSPASASFRLPTGRRDAGAPRRFMGRWRWFFSPAHIRFRQTEVGLATSKRTRWPGFFRV